MKKLEKKNYANEFTKTVEERGHKIVNGIYVNNQSVLKIHCLKHGEIFDVVARHYKQARFGTSCCTPIQQRAAVNAASHLKKGSKLSLETRNKISTALKGKPKKYTSWLKNRKGSDHPAFKDGQGHGTRNYDHEKHSAWIQGVKRASNFKCFITGKDRDLHCHHLIGFQHEPTRYLIENGVAICKDIHIAFHAKYGTGYNTPDQFEEFCRKNYNIITFPWQQGNHKPSYSLIEEQEKKVNMSQQKANEFTKIVEERGHKIIDGIYVNNQSVLKIHCLKHGKSFDVLPGKYKKARFGIPCCASEKQSAVVVIANRNRKK